ncbi:uncharacterized protein A4U43_C04F3450 [Asparagus officinalis]|uniref:Uncharacterized protein n=1 Tax=Asparagus officinalis TaxID=4686 RepID=A0A5P1F0N1_ASPOF|nr:uncharacterized protein A4U43_C04F3450 [Asparagus officinalis]
MDRAMLALAFSLAFFLLQEQLPVHSLAQPTLEVNPSAYQLSRLDSCLAKVAATVSVRRPSRCSDSGPDTAAPRTPPEVSTARLATAARRKCHGKRRRGEACAARLIEVTRFRAGGQQRRKRSYDISLVERFYVPYPFVPQGGQLAPPPRGAGGQILTRG